MGIVLFLGMSIPGVPIWSVYVSGKRKVKGSLIYYQLGRASPRVSLALLSLLGSKSGSSLSYFISGYPLGSTFGFFLMGFFWSFFAPSANQRNRVVKVLVGNFNYVVGARVAARDI